MKINTSDQATKDFYCGFTADPIKIVGRVIVPIRSNGLTYDNTAFCIKEGHERNILVNDNLPRVGIELAQKPFPHYKKNIESKSLINSVGSYKSETKTIFKKFNILFGRIDKIKNQIEITYFQDPLKPIHSKGRMIPLDLFPAVSKELDRLISEGHFKNLKSSKEDRFIS